MWTSNLLNSVIALLPFAKRKYKFINWTRVFVSYISTMYEDLKVLRTKSVRIAFMTPQVCMVEKYLNDRFNIGLIYITDGNALGPWIWQSDNPSIFYLDRTDSFVWGHDSPSFIVNVPTDMDESWIPELVAIVSKFKLPGKSFIVYKYDT